MLNAVMETVADVLPSASASSLREGSIEATRALSSVVAASGSSVDRLSPDFIAGRLAAIIDILGYAAASTAEEADIEAARKAPYAGIILHLADGRLLDTDIARRTGMSEEETAAVVLELARMGMTSRMMLGTSWFNTLTPVGALMAVELSAD